MDEETSTMLWVLGTAVSAFVVSWIIGYAVGRYKGKRGR